MKQHIKQLSKPYIKTDNFNSHNMIWGSKSLDKRVRTIEQFLSDATLIIKHGDSYKIQHTQWHINSIRSHNLQLVYYPCYYQEDLHKPIQQWPLCTNYLNNHRKHKKSKIPNRTRSDQQFYHVRNYKSSRKDHTKNEAEVSKSISSLVESIMLDHHQEQKPTAEYVQTSTYQRIPWKIQNSSIPNTENHYWK